jgi:gluconate 5-dehydrogenase
LSEKLFDLSGKVAIVTGASRGLGQYFGRSLAKAGADLVITSRNIDSLVPFETEIESLGRKALPLQLDVCNYSSIQKMVDSIMEHMQNRYPGIMRVNVRKRAVDITWEDWNFVLDTNLRGAFFVAQAVVKKMIPKRHGRIINIGSVTCVFGYAGLAPYCASRGGIKQLTMSLADDWGIYGITVNCLAPGWFRTEQTASIYDNKDWMQYICDRIPLKRPGKPHDLDGAIVFLSSDASEYITGQTILVDGGISTGATRAMSDK